MQGVSAGARQLVTPVQRPVPSPFCFLPAPLSYAGDTAKLSVMVTVIAWPSWPSGGHAPSVSNQPVQIATPHVCC